MSSLTDQVVPKPLLPPISPSTGQCVLHLFCKIGEHPDVRACLDAIESFEKEGGQAISVSILGHKADIGFMLLGKDLWRLKVLQSTLQRASFILNWSYLSLTEVSEYAKDLPQSTVQSRLNPVLPPEGMNAFCFYPMSRRRMGHDNWYLLDYEKRRSLMISHGMLGREYAGRVVQLVTGSSGLDDYEWGVSLFAVAPDDLKSVVYRMRFDLASARYGEFGPFYMGVIASHEEVLSSLGLG